MALTNASSLNDFWCIVSNMADINNNCNLVLRRILILRGIATILMDFLDNTTSSEEDEDEVECVMHVMEKPKKLPRLENYVENIVPTYSDKQFKLHFR